MVCATEIATNEEGAMSLAFEIHTKGDHLCICETGVGECLHACTKPSALQFLSKSGTGFV